MDRARDAETSPSARRPPQDDNALRGGLADRDSARPLTGLVLIPERESVPVAAVALRNGTAIADPLEPSADAMSALRAVSLRDPAPGRTRRTRVGPPAPSRPRHAG